VREREIDRNEAPIDDLVYYCEDIFKRWRFYKEANPTRTVRKVQPN
jgi:hypothetical protein